MNQLYPLKFEPIIKNPIWGGEKLRELLKKEKATDKSGESWEISSIEGSISIVSNGYLEGNNLQELLEIYMGDLVGQRNFEKFGIIFPLLFKFIDASDDLSIQVHPDDEVALKRHNSFGKTEMWYIMQADKNSELIAGFNQNIDKVIFEKELKDKTLDSILNKEKVSAGDVFFIPTGRLHAIGKGILLAEIQQTSNVTYRVFDYNRVDSKGKERELHNDLAIDIINYEQCCNCKTEYENKLNQATELASCKYFTTNLIELDSSIERDMLAFDSFIVYMVIDGDVEIKYRDKETVSVKSGETVLIPAEIPHYYLIPKKKSKLLEVYIAPNKDKNEDKNS